ncbi:MAG: hypothetical protein H6842_09405 [Rhodospirillaceae bacterium]|nr:hypothetical protein [Rhodospirillaceae bacterium]
MAASTGGRSGQGRNLPVPVDQIPALGKGAAVPRAGAKRPANKADKAALIVAVCLAPLALFVLPTTVLFFGGMVPTIVSFVADRTQEKYLPMIVGSLNFCGVMPAGFELWGGAATTDRALKLLADPFNMAMMLGAAGLGWVIYTIVPAMVSATMVWRNEQDIARWQARQEALVSEWGREVTGDVEQLPGLD